MHIICFDQPFPPVYGGAIDVYYKLKALHAAGIRLVVHIFMYNGSKRRKEIEEIAENTYYYNRKTGLMSNLTLLPYIVNSRRDTSLIDNLCADNDDILFEGLHTTFFIKDKRLAGRNLMVRMHNIEHKYYLALAKSCPFSIKTPYYLLESIRLKLYEKKLDHATRILPISHADYDYFMHRFPNKDIRLLQCFYNNMTTIPYSGTEPYILYHGNLAHTENIRAVKYILSHADTIIPDGWRLIIAGRQPTASVYRMAKGKENVEIIASPATAEMEKIIAHAHINLLITFQETGVKLKLLNTLSHSYGHCIVNTSMIYGTELRQICHVADSIETRAEKIRSLTRIPVTEHDYIKRQRFLYSLGFNDIRAIIE